jgi:copper oxidase (laccase) domain-containing protein
MDKFGNWMNYLYKKNDSKYILDLKEANRASLVEAGVNDIEIMNICTRCNSDFHSYRRDGKGVGRQLSFIGLV